jgi:hypothetical protein
VPDGIDGRVSAGDPGLSAAIGRLDLATSGHARTHRPGTIESVADSIRCNPLDLVAN